MRAYRLKASGHGVDGLHLVEEPVPTPGPNEVLVKVHATSLSFREKMVLRGDYVLPVEPNIVPISDGAGEVVAVGSNVAQLRVGDRVAANIFPDWQDGPLQFETISQLGSSVDGMLREYAVLPQAALVRVPDHLSYIEAATLPCAGVTAWNALTGGERLGPDSTVLTLGTGGVSLFAVQFAKHLGARVIATTGDTAKEPLLRRLGADAVVNYRAEQWSELVRTLTDGRGVDLVVDVVGQINQSLSLLRLGGEVAFVGFLAEQQVEQIDLKTLFYSGGSVRAVSAGSRAHFLAMNAAISQGRLRPVIAETFGFTQAAEAYRHYQEHSPFGKVVITHDVSV